MPVVSSIAREAVSKAVSRPASSFMANVSRAPVGDRLSLAVDRAMTDAEHVPLLKRCLLGVWSFLAKFKRPGADVLPLRNQGELTPMLLRGAQPNEAGFAQLKAQGVDTVINLQAETNWEHDVVQKLGMKPIQLPYLASDFPSNQDFTTFLRTASDPANGKVYFHCLFGKDRTGAMAASYRIAAQGWTPDQAIAEMFKYQYHPGLEDGMAVSVRRFARHWKALPQTMQDAILHRTPVSPRA